MSKAGSVYTFWTQKQICEDLTGQRGSLCSGASIVVKSTQNYLGLGSKLVKITRFVYLDFLGPKFSLL